MDPDFDPQPALSLSHGRSISAVLVPLWVRGSFKNEVHWSVLLVTLLALQGSALTDHYECNVVVEQNGYTLEGHVILLLYTLGHKMVVEVETR